MTGLAYRAKGVLQKYRKLEIEITARQETIQHLFDSATRATPSLEAERVSGTGERSRLESVMARKIDLERRMDEKLDELTGMRDSIVAVIDSMEVSEERSILFYRYIQGRSWQYIMTKMYISERTSYRIHDSALIHFGELYF